MIRMTRHASTAGWLTAMALALFTWCLPAVAQSPAMAQNTDPTFDSAVFLLRQSISPSARGNRSMSLRSLRHMADPAMQPLFETMAQSDDPFFKIHGLLGLAECSPGKSVDLVRIAAVEDPAAQAELVSAAMDSDLLTLDQCQQLVDWPGLDVAVKIVVSAPLVQANRMGKLDPLLAAAKADNLGRRSLANLLLMQLGKPEASQALDELNASDSPQRDQVRDMLLRTALRYEFDRAGPWAMKIAAEPGVRPQLALQALAVALRFNTPGSVSIWQQQFAATHDLAQRIRLAMIALRVSPWSSPELFTPMVRDTDELLSNIGKAGHAVASKKDITPHVVALVEMHHPIANSWALSYAAKDASAEDAKLILLSLVLAFEQGPSRGREQRLDDAISATQALVERSPDDAIRLIQPLLAAPGTPAILKEGILLGLLRARAPRAHEVITGLPPFENVNARNMALLLLTRHDQPLSSPQMADLALCVRGGGLPLEALRVQAAWLWLKRTHQLDRALGQVLKP